MANGVITIKLETKFNRLPELPAATRRRISQVVRKVASDVEARAKQIVPVDTGATKNSIRAQTVNELTSEVVVGTHYAAYLEFGTHKMPARPYLRPAVEAVRPAFEAAIGQAIEEAAGA
jgi:HK97 gp10 family phage protein